MKRYNLIVWAMLPLLLFSWLWLEQKVVANEPSQYVLVNLHRHEFNRDDLLNIVERISGPAESDIRVGISTIYSYFSVPGNDPAALERFLQQMRTDLALVQEVGLPFLIQLDGEQWWGARPELWNWWDPERPGFNPQNAHNVEWYGWGPEYALKIAWRNWGRQLRVLPPPNLMSPAYIAAWTEKMEAIIPVILEWYEALPEDQQYLFVGVKVGWESSIGVNAWYYPDGNAKLHLPEADDPQTGLTGSMVPCRGVQTIGFSALTSAGIRDSGEVTEADLAEVARRHLENLSRLASQLGVPRNRLFTHGAGWKSEELLYDAAVNQYSSPGWSFYGYATDPRRDRGVARALELSDAPYWAATEWLLFHDNKEQWTSALENTLSMPRMRYICIFNWQSIRNSPTVHEAIKNVVSAGVR